jgi:hypothetical protein
MNRAASVIAVLPSSVHVIVKTSRDLFDRFRQAIGRPIELVEGVFDCGAIHPPGESSLVDCTATLETYRRIHAAAESRLNREVTFLREGRFAVVVSDIAPLPLRAARIAGVPGILVANFTWYDIFRHYVRTSGFRPDDQNQDQNPTRSSGDRSSADRSSADRSSADRLAADGSETDRWSETTGSRWCEMLNQMQREYACATLVLRAQPAIVSQSLAPVRDVGLLAGKGRRRTGELRRVLRLRRAAPLVYVYVGRYGQSDMQWNNLHRLDGFEFISYHDVPAGLGHWHVVDPRDWSPSDLAASVDVMVAKAGYGTVADAMVNRTPLIFPPRHGFAEHRILASGLRRWGGGISLGTREFKTLKLRPALDRALATDPGTAPWPANGAVQVRRAILRLAGTSHLRG